MTLKLLEGAVSALLSYLQGNMAAKLDVLDAEYGDVELADIKKWYGGNIPTDIPEYPSVCLQGINWTPEERTSDTLYLKSFINVIVFVGDNNDQVRFHRLCRYARAVVELLRSGEATYGYAHKVEGSVLVSDTLGTPTFLQAISIPISLYPLSGETY